MVGLGVMLPCLIPQCHHNGRDGVSNNQPRYCLLNRLFRRRSNETSKLRVTGLCAGNLPGPGVLPANSPQKGGTCFHFMISSWENQPDIPYFGKWILHVRTNHRHFIIFKTECYEGATLSSLGHTCCYHDNFWCHKLWQIWYYHNCMFSMVIRLCTVNHSAV